MSLFESNVSFFTNLLNFEEKQKKFDSIESMQSSFYFLRHAETDHNVYGIYDDTVDVYLNENGIQQAIDAQKLMNQLPFETVCSSPLSRVQQTKDIVLKDKKFEDLILDDFRECPGALWRLFLASELRSLTLEELKIIEEFFLRIEKGLFRALSCKGPLLLIAHGGTYWAISHLLKLEGNKKVGNCVCIKVFWDPSLGWKSEAIK